MGLRRPGSGSGRRAPYVARTKLPEGNEAASRLSMTHPAARVIVPATTRRPSSWHGVTSWRSSAHNVTTCQKNAGRAAGAQRVAVDRRQLSGDRPDQRLNAWLNADGSE